MRHDHRGNDRTHRAAALSVKETREMEDVERKYVVFLRRPRNANKEKKKQMKQNGAESAKIIHDKPNKEMTSKQSVGGRKSKEMIVKEKVAYEGKNKRLFG